MPDGISLPKIWVRAHPFGDRNNQDAHKEHFDNRTQFYDDLLPTVPLSYYHNHTPDGQPMGEPVAIGITAGRQYRNPETGEVDGRWDKTQWFDNVSLDIKERIQRAIEKGTLRASPTVVPDFHKVESDGRISHWLTGSIAIFDAEGSRQPANPRAIGIAEMKALYKAANLEFPNLQGVTMAQAKSNWMKQFIHTLKALFDTMPQEAAPVIADDDETAPLEHLDEWEEIFGKDETISELKTETNDKQEDSQEDTAMDEKQLAEKIRGDVIAEYDNKMKAMLDSNTAVQTENARIRRELDETKLGAWFDDQLRAGKVMPAEKGAIIEMALQLKADDDMAHPTMKSADGTAMTRLDAFKATIEARQASINFDPTMKMAGFDTPEKDAAPSPERTAKLLEMTGTGRAILKDKNGNGK